MLKTECIYAWCTLDMCCCQHKFVITCRQDTNTQKCLLPVASVWVYFFFLIHLQWMPHVFGSTLQLPPSAPHEVNIHTKLLSHFLLKRPRHSGRADWVLTWNLEHKSNATVTAVGQKGMGNMVGILIRTAVRGEETGTKKYLFPLFSNSSRGPMMIVTHNKSIFNCPHLSR